MNDYIDIQHACTIDIPIANQTLIQWVNMTLPPEHATTELTIRFVDKEEITTLNHLYRKLNKPTNVLAFPSTLPEMIMNAHPFLGDIIICPEILNEESLELKIPLIAHWAHIVIHGVLHLLGHDHYEVEETTKMQTIEIKLLHELGFDNPYQSEEENLE